MRRTTPILAALAAFAPAVAHAQTYRTYQEAISRSTGVAGVAQPTDAQVAGASSPTNTVVRVKADASGNLTVAGAAGAADIEVDVQEWGSVAVTAAAATGTLVSAPTVPFVGAVLECQSNVGGAVVEACDYDATNGLKVDVARAIGTAADAGALPATTYVVSGYDGANVQVIKTDTNGELQVDVLALPGGLTGYAEDAAHVTGDFGVEVLAVRSDVKATTAGTTGDYAALIEDADGDLYVSDTVAQGYLATIDADTSSIVAALDVALSTRASEATLAAAAASLVAIDTGTPATAPTTAALANGLNVHGSSNALVVEAVVTGRGSATATSEIKASGLSASTDEFDENTALNVAAALIARRDDTNVEYVYQDHATNHALRVSLYGAQAAAGDTAISVDATGGVRVWDGDSALTVDGTVSADTELAAGAALTDNFSNPTVPGIAAFGMVWDGATWDRAPGTSTDGVLVNLGTNNTVIKQDAGYVTPTVFTLACDGTEDALPNTAGRDRLVFTNTGTVDATIGLTGVVAGTGMLVGAGQTFDMPVGSVALYCRTAGTSVTLGGAEWSY